LDLRHYPVLAQVSLSYSEPKGRFPRVTHPCATRPEGLVRLACVRHAASVRSEPESNSQVDDRQPLRGKPKRKPASPGAVPALHIYCGYVTRHEGSHQGKPWLRSLGTADFTARRHPEVVADRGRRPHVPSSKPTMSKSRRVSSPLDPGQSGYRLRRRKRGRAKPRPAGGWPYMGEVSARQ
jgi:hypothetical protein